MKTTVVWQNGDKITYKHYSTLLNYEDTDRIGKERGYGETVVIGFSLPFSNRILKAMQDFYAGIKYHYPVCCILNFCIDGVLDRPSAQLRWSDETEYVECFLHIRKRCKKPIPLDLY